MIILIDDGDRDGGHARRSMHVVRDSIEWGSVVEDGMRVGIVESAGWHGWHWWCVRASESDVHIAAGRMRIGCSVDREVSCAITSETSAKGRVASGRVHGMHRRATGRRIRRPGVRELRTLRGRLLFKTSTGRERVRESCGATLEWRGGSLLLLTDGIRSGIDARHEGYGVWVVDEVIWGQSGSEGRTVGEYVADAGALFFETGLEP